MFNELKIYINNRITLAKYDLVDSLSNMLASGIYVLIIAVFSLFLVLLGSLALGFILGSYFDNTGLGFLAVTGIYLLMMVLSILFRKKLKLFIVNITIENAMEAMSNQDDDEDDDDE
ncbi:phage holin family protein [Empedobacter brevis]|uniref:phage holin family protein n=1 Tax=Empedobacter brevis TaxID=247 RepID=UPI0039AF65F5